MVGDNGRVLWIFRLIKKHLILNWNNRRLNNESDMDVIIARKFNFGVNIGLEVM